jgi:Tfp pilus assembly protein PilX
VIEGWAGRRSAIAFTLLVLAVLTLGLIGLLSLNTAMDENSIKMQQAEQRQAQLTDREQQLSQQLSGLSAPGRLASAAAAQGLVPNPQPAFLNPTTGALLGSASPAPSPSASPTPSRTPSPTATPSATPSASTGATPAPSASGSPR